METRRKKNPQFNI